MPRKVLFYTHAFGGGGAEIVFGRLAKAFAERGDIVIFAADYPGPIKVRDQINCRHVLLGSDHAASVRQLHALLQKERPDVSFSALGAQNLKHVAAALVAGRLHRCVLGFHGFAAAEAKLFSRSCFWASPIVTRAAAKTICVSDVLLEDMRKRWGASRSRTLRIYNPIAEDDAALHRVEKDEPPLIVGCGRLVPGKRFTDLVAALAEVKPSNARLAILGEGPELAAIKAVVARLDLGQRVDLPGHVDDPSPWYRRAACLAIASESESFGLTAAEALQQGTPVVATDCGGPAEILDQGRFGRIVPVGDIAALASALTDTLATPGAPEPRRQRANAFALATIQKAYADLADSLK